MKKYLMFKHTNVSFLQTHSDLPRKVLLCVSVCLHLLQQKKIVCLRNETIAQSTIVATASSSSASVFVCVFVPVMGFLPHYLHK